MVAEIALTAVRHAFGVARAGSAKQGLLEVHILRKHTAAVAVLLSVI